jgi:hypothetical protein
VDYPLFYNIHDVLPLPSLPHSLECAVLSVEMVSVYEISEGLFWDQDAEVHTVLSVTSSLQSLPYWFSYMR